MDGRNNNLPTNKQQSQQANEQRYSQPVQGPTQQTNFAKPNSNANPQVRPSVTVTAISYTLYDPVRRQIVRYKSIITV